MHLEKIAFQFVEAISDISDINVLNQRLCAFLKNVGGDYFVGAQLVFPGGALRATNIFGTHQHDWLDFYRNHHLFFEDPAAFYIRSSAKPFTWSWISKSFDLTASERMVMNEPRNFGLAEGLVLPVYGPARAVAGFSVAGEFFKPDPSEVAAVQMVINAAYIQATKLIKLFETARPSKLTKRQRECLKLVQEAKVPVILLPCWVSAMAQ